MPIIEDTEQITGTLWCKAPNHAGISGKWPKVGEAGRAKPAKRSSASVVARCEKVLAASSRREVALSSLELHSRGQGWSSRGLSKETAEPWTGRTASNGRVGQEPLWATVFLGAPVPRSTSDGNRPQGKPESPALRRNPAGPDREAELGLFGGLGSEGGQHDLVLDIPQGQV